MTTVMAGQGHQGQPEQEKALPPLLADFRTALREEIEAARRAASSAAIEIFSGRRIGERGGGTVSPQNTEQDEQTSRGSTERRRRPRLVDLPQRAGPPLHASA